MEYQALARKYRPRNFASLMGQEHVSKALGNALRTQRLHHAYLFSGTRGVGKTTIARILAKSLNCETGIVAEPCGQCSTCREIDEGRFIDLLEVDAASKTKVEDTRDMLDNVQYAPVRGRFKIYLIDEVHMLSGHSFNALLKTLEEPPEHVKFLLATTDPKKLPITVLSRCLQFNLRHLSLQQISKQLTKILQLENIEFEAQALQPIAQAADGSMRDALSLLDQAIAFTDGKLNLANIDSMLGNIPIHHIVGIISALVENNAQKMIDTLHEILSLGMGVDNVLTELINALQKMAMLQMLPQVISENQQQNSYQQNLQILSEQISVENVQLYYQIALSGRSDLDLSPFPQAALEMILLRMLAFKPVMTGAAEYSQ
ncbi:MAG: DNA polymerase III subunit gamma/tau, partial [Pseudomonadota bacterium]